MDHSECVKADRGTTRAHTHEGEPGWWLFPGDFNADGSVKGIY